MICAEAVRERDTEKSLATEKLLVNLISHCMQASAMDQAMQCCEMVKERLEQASKERDRAEISALLKTVADLLWSFSHQVEQQGVVGADRILQMRQLSLVMLLPAKPDLQLLVTRATNTDAQFRKAKGRGGSIQHSYAQLNDLHLSLLSHKELKSCLSSTLGCGTVCSVLLWLLQAAKSQSIHLKKAHTTLNNHLQGCNKEKHAAESLLLELSWLTSSLQSSATPSNEWVARLQESSSLLLSVSVGGTPTLLHRMVDAVDCLTMTIRSLWKRWREGGGERHFMTAGVFRPLKLLVISYVEWVAAILKSQLSSLPKGSVEERAEQLKCGVVSRQLAALSIVNDVLLEALLAKDEDDEEIELPRGRPPPPASQGHPTAMLALECLPLLEQSQKILSSAPLSLAPAEHRWLGSSAYNLGLTLHQAGLNRDAVPVLQLACQELLDWCQLQQPPSFDEVW